ncbi:hypothetical protein PV325_011114 [Microctonus aethiopoides]|nr:hypothetical protein PV325_011114 [Microctonus aethiopoides]
MDRGRLSPASEAVQPLVQEQSQYDHSETSEESMNAEVIKLKNNASNAEILEAMKHLQNGVGFLAPHLSLPSQTFQDIFDVSELRGPSGLEFSKN